MAVLSVLESEVSKLIVDSLNLEEIKSEDIDPDAPLFREGLGLDSIDALELSLAISRTYGIQLKSDDPGINRIFSSLRELSSHIGQNREQ